MNKSLKISIIFTGVSLFFLPAIEKSIHYWKLSTMFFRIKKELSLLRTNASLKVEGFAITLYEGHNEEIKVYKLDSLAPCDDSLLSNVMKSYPLKSSILGKYSVISPQKIVYCFYPHKSPVSSIGNNFEFSLRILNESFFYNNNPNDINFMLDLESFDFKT